MIHWIVLDAMGVVFTVGDDTNDLLVPFIQERNGTITRDDINVIYRRASLGEMSSRQFWTDVGLAGEYPGVETKYLDEALTVDPAFKPVAMRLARQFRMGLLSNDLAEWSRYLRVRRGLAFDAVTISGEARCRKPSPEIYRAFLRVSGARPRECVFVDDRARNLEAAHALGFRTILFGADGDGRATEAADAEADDMISGFAELEAAIERIQGGR